MTRFRAAPLVLAAFATALSGCGSRGDSGPVNVAIIGEPETLEQQGVRLAPAAQAVRAASHEGLVAMGPSGEIVPALAERWIVTDDGLSYIFRIRNTQWPDGEPVTARDIRTLLRDTFRRLEGTSLGLDLAKVTEIRAMTGRVVELRLSAPMPEFLRLMAQPELGFVRNGAGEGPMLAERDEDTGILRLTALPPEQRGLPALREGEDGGRPVDIRALPAQAAVDAFTRGQVDLVLNGRLTDFPLAEVGTLSRGAIQVDPALGVLGLVFRNDDGLLGDVARREALSMALDREALIQPFGLGGWQPTTWIVPPSQFTTAPYPATRWDASTLEERRATAARRIAQWRTQSGAEAVVRVALPEGPGSDILFDQLAAQWSRIGVQAVRAESGTAADLELRDRLARYSSPRWFLNQFNCELTNGPCSPEADAQVRASLRVSDQLDKELAYAQAHRALVDQEVYIPLGAPVRWSLVRGLGTAYLPNQWGLHPLFPLSQPTT